MTKGRSISSTFSTSCQNFYSRDDGVCLSLMKIVNDLRNSNRDGIDYFRSRSQVIIYIMSHRIYLGICRINLNSDISVPLKIILQFFFVSFVINFYLIIDNCQQHIINIFRPIRNAADILQISDWSRSEHKIQHIQRS